MLLQVQSCNLLLRLVQALWLPGQIPLEPHLSAALANHLLVSPVQRTHKIKQKLI